MFEYRTALPIDVVAQRLQALERPRTSLFQMRSTQVLITPRDNSHLDFEINARRYGRGADNIVVRAVGSVTIDLASGETIVSVDLRPGYPRLFLLISSGVVAVVFIAAVSSYNPPESLLSMRLFVTAVLAWAAYTYWKDWHDLDRAIKTATESSANDSA